MRMRIRRPSRRTPKTLSKTQGPKKSLPELIKSAKGAKNVLTGKKAVNALTRRPPTGTPQKLKEGATAPKVPAVYRPNINKKPTVAQTDAMKRRARQLALARRRFNQQNEHAGRNALGGTKRRRITGTPRPKTTTPKPPETRELADARRMSPNVDTRMKQLSIDRGRTKGAKSSVMDKSLGIDARMAALAKERRAKGQYKSKARIASDARKKAMATAKARANAIASLRGLGNKAVKSRGRLAKEIASSKPKVTGIRRLMGSILKRRRRKSRI